MSTADRQVQPEEAAGEMLLRRRAREGLLAFTDYTHHSWRTSEHHRKICALLERAERREVKRVAIFAPPRHSKSELASRRLPAWWLGRNTNSQIITATYSSDFAADFGSDVRGIVRSPEYHSIFPSVGLSPDRKAMGRWNTTNGGFYVSASLSGGLTGRGADLLVIDDPHKNREDADSRKKREKVWKEFRAAATTRLQKDGVIVLMMTRWHEDDLAGRALQNGNWEVLELPAIADEDDANERALWPDEFPIDELHSKRTELGPREWAALYQQRPRTEVGAYIEREWLERGGPPDALRVYMASDFAVTEATEGGSPDYTEHGVFGVDSANNLHVLDWWHGRTTPDVWIEQLVDMFSFWKPICWFGEGGVIRRSVEPFLKKRMLEQKTYVRCEWINPTRDKHARGRGMQARCSMRKVIFPKIAWADRLIDQLVGFPSTQFDDAFDTLSLMCLAIDQAHPGVESAAKPQMKRGPERDYGFGNDAVNDWKTA